VSTKSWELHAGQTRARHDPHVSWHSDGRFHNKSFGKVIFPRRQRQALEAFTGSEQFISTSVDRREASFLPDCDLGEFHSVAELDAAQLNDVPHRTRVDIELVGPGSEAAALWAGSRSVQRYLFADRNPSIVVSFVDTTAIVIPFENQG